jgi:hypothetical protein
MSWHKPRRIAVMAIQIFMYHTTGLMDPDLYYDLPILFQSPLYLNTQRWGD